MYFFLQGVFQLRKICQLAINIPKTYFNLNLIDRKFNYCLSQQEYANYLTASSTPKAEIQNWLQVMMPSLNMSSQASCVMEIPLLLLLEADLALLINVILNSIISAAATVGNLLIIVSILRSSTLHSTANFLLLGLAVSDLGVGVVVEPLFINILLRRYKGLLVNCTLVVMHNVASSFFVVVSMFTVTAISIDRYLAIYFHLRYPEFITTKKVIYLQLTLWATSGVLALTRMAGFRMYLVIGMALIVICLSLTCFAYSKIFIVLRRHQAQIQIQMSTETISKMKQLRNSVINTFYVVFAFLVCFLPYCCLTIIIIHNSGTRSKDVMLLNLYASSIILFNSSLNPFIYWWRRRELRETVKQTLLKTCC